jgi:hypothetical protein
MRTAAAAGRIHLNLTTPMRPPNASREIAPRFGDDPRDPPVFRNVLAFAVR